jgi:WhiB family transcriptional regulator, redox-sensing transcriptional regulator
VALAVADLPDPEPAATLSGLLGLSRPAWQAQAACRGMGPDDWFPPRGAAQAPALRRAREICAGCPVREQCAEFAGTDPHGVWGGLSVDQRKRRGRSRRAGAATGPAGAQAAPQRSGGPAPPPKHGGRQGGFGTGAARQVPMESVFDPDTRTVEQWRTSPAGDHTAPSAMDEILAVLLEQVFGRARS